MVLFITITLTIVAAAAFAPCTPPPAQQLSMRFGGARPTTTSPTITTSPTTTTSRLLGTQILGDFGNNTDDSTGKTTTQTVSDTGVNRTNDSSLANKTKSKTNVISKNNNNNVVGNAFVAGLWGAAPPLVGAVLAWGVVNQGLGGGFFTSDFPKLVIKQPTLLAGSGTLGGAVFTAVMMIFGGFPKAFGEQQAMKREDDKEERAAKREDDKEERAAKREIEKEERAAKREDDKEERAAKREDDKEERAAKWEIEKEERAAKREEQRYVFEQQLRLLEMKKDPQADIAALDALLDGLRNQTLTE